jgi:membrane protease subunit HflC
MRMRNSINEAGPSTPGLNRHLTMNTPKYRSGQSKFPVLMLIVIVGLLVLSGSVFTVSERELAVVLQFGQPVNAIDAPGLYFKIPMVQEVRRLPATKQFWRSSESDTLVDLPSKDGKKIEVSAWAVWKITKPESFVRVLRTVENRERAVKVRVRAVIRDVITSYDLAEAVRSTDRELTYSFRFEQKGNDLDSREETKSVPTLGGKVDSILVGREKIMDEIRQRIQQRLTAEAEEGESPDGSTDRGIELVDVGISDISFVPSVRLASFDRLKAFMESIAAGYENEGQQRKQEVLNLTNAEVEKILGEGEEQSKLLRGQVDAEIISRYADAIEKTGDFYNFIKTLEIYEAALKGNTRLILTTDSPIFKLLKEVETRGEPRTPARVPRAASGDQ